MNWIDNLNIGISFFQDTYSAKEYEPERSKDFNNKHCCFAHVTNHSKGCLVLKKHKIDCTFKSKELHSEGRHVILQVEINGEDYIIGNTYCQTNSNEREVYYKEFPQTLQHTGVDENRNIILGGDWNTIQKNTDRKSTKTHA